MHIEGNDFVPNENEESEEAHQQVGAMGFFSVYEASHSTRDALGPNMWGGSRASQAAKTNLLFVLIGAKTLFLDHLK